MGSRLFTVSAQASVLEGPRADPVPPNIVFFLVDDMGWQETSVPFHVVETELNRRYRTPNMERLAASGMKFTQAYACAVCSPTRVSLMTGMNAARHRVTCWTLRKDRSPEDGHPRVQPPAWNLNGLSPVPGIERTVVANTLPMRLQEAGYRTIHVGKAHWGAQGTPGEDPRQLGFDINIAGHAAGGPGSYHGTNNFSAVWRKGDRIWDVPGLEAYHGKDIYLTEALTREARRAVSQAVADRVPFYLYLSHYAIHAPWEKDTRFFQPYLDDGLTPFEATYASMVESMDKSLGDILDQLEALGVTDHTVVIFMSDNGSPSQAPRNLPLRGHKLTPYEGGIRVPMLARWPGVTPPGSTNASPVIIEDLFPTFLELAGLKSSLPSAGAIDGVSLVPWLKGANPNGADRSLFWHYPNTYDQPPYSAVRQGDWKLIYHHVTRRLELFDLPADIGETEDLARQEPARVEKLAGILTEFLCSADAQMPIDRESGSTVEYPIDAWHRQQLPARARSQAKVPLSAIAENLEWAGVAIQEPDYTIWGASPIIAEDGKVHLFAARWPELNVDPAWRKSSEIAHYVAERPEGPFTFHSVVLQGSGRTGEWDAFAPHNPEIARFGDTYALLYIGNSDYRQPPHPLNQQIGMAVATSIEGPWKKVGTDGLILGPSPDPTHWTHGHQVVNPAILKVGQRYHLYFKSRYQDGTGYGLAIADHLEGPYVMEPEPLSSEGVVIEDGTVFMWGGKVCLITTDNHGRVTGIRGGGALWVSDDGKRFDPRDIQVAYHRIPRYLSTLDLANVRKVYGPDPKIERPKILTMGGEPRYLYGPSGWAVHGGPRTANYVLRIRLPSDAGPLPADLNLIE